MTNLSMLGAALYVEVSISFNISIKITIMGWINI